MVRQETLKANISGGAKPLGIVVIKQVPINTARMLDWVTGAVLYGSSLATGTVSYSSIPRI